MEIFIANLDTGIEEALLVKLFEPFGAVSSTIVARDKETQTSKGFGFVVMENAVEAQRAIDDLNGRELAGKELNVKISIPKEQRLSGNTGQERSYSNKHEEAIPLEVIDELDYGKEILSDGHVRIKFIN